jgi:DHA1 family bicyclomycin/chloramphenicol resistance-like MFS transporter
LLTSLCPFSIDMYLPTFIKVAGDFHVPPERMSLTLSAFFIGLAGGQLVYGPLLDRFGRKKPLYIGLVIYMAATLGCAFSRSLEEMMVFRAIQAIGGCGANIAAMALVRDFFTGKEGTKVFSLLILILGASPLLAPTIGGQLAVSFGWRSIFVVLTGLALGMLLLSWRWLPAGQPPNPEHPLHPIAIVKGYWEILLQPHFYTYALAASWALCGLFVYLAMSPMLFMNVFQVTPKTYGRIFGLLAMGFVGSSQCNFWLLKRFSNEGILRYGLIGMVTVGYAFLAGAMLDILGLPGTMVMLFLFLACFGISGPNATSLALAPFGHNAGSASALIGFLQMGIGSIASVGIGFVHTQRILPVAQMFAACATLAFLTLLAGSRFISPEDRRLHQAPPPPIVE